MANNKTPGTKVPITYFKDKADMCLLPREIFVFTCHFVSLLACKIFETSNQPIITCIVLNFLPTNPRY